MAIIPGTGLIISLEYDPTGLEWVRLYDNLVLGWYVSDTIPEEIVPAVPLSGATAGRVEGPIAEPLAGVPPAVAPGIAPHPIILGHLLAKVVTDPVISPQWCKYTEPNHPGAAQGSVFVQDLWRARSPTSFVACHQQRRAAQTSSRT
jgi:hypothetical protein